MCYSSVVTCVTVVVLHLQHVTGAVWAHNCCAMWSENVEQSDGRLRYVDRAVFNGLSQVSHSFITYCSLEGYMHLGVHTHTHMYANMYTHTHTEITAHMHTQACAHTHTQKLMHALTSCTYRS